MMDDQNKKKHRSANSSQLRQMVQAQSAMSNRTSENGPAQQLVLSPQMMPVEASQNHNISSRSSKLAHSSKEAGLSKGLARKKSNQTDKSLQPFKQDSAPGTFRNLVQTKAQQQAKNPGLAYIKRESMSNRLAKASTQKRKTQNQGPSKNNSQRAQAAAAFDASQQISPRNQQPQTQGKRRSSVSSYMPVQQNVDLAHMQISTDRQQTLVDVKQAGSEPGQGPIFSGEQTTLHLSQHQNQPLGSVDTLQDVPDKTNKDLQQPSPKVRVQPAGRSSAQYARFRLQEHIKSLSKPKHRPICGPRADQLSNVVFEQQVASNFNALQNNRQNPANENFSSPHHVVAQFRPNKVGARSGLTAPVTLQDQTLSTLSGRPQSSYVTRGDNHMNLAVATQNIIQQQMHTSQSIRHLLT